MKGKLPLFIDTSSNQQTIVRLGDTTLKRRSTAWKSQAVLPMIAQVLKAQKATLKDISDIKVATKGTSFTGLRVGAAVANALKFALKTCL